MASLTGIKKDDIVRCEVRGQRFWALVSKEAHTDKVRGRGLTVRELEPRAHIPTLFVKASEVVGRWKRMSGAMVDV